jgi:hypothetical protein
VDPMNTGPVDGVSETANRRLPWAIVGVALVAVAAFAIVTFGANDNDGSLSSIISNSADDELEGASPTITSPTIPQSDGTEAPAATGAPTVTLPADASQVGHDNPQIEDLMREVERIRGLAFLSEVDTEFMSDEDFQARVTADVDEDLDPAQIGELEAVWQALELIDPDLDLYSAVLQLYGEGIIGFYDTEENLLVMRGLNLTPAVQSTLVHELTHALDDQQFELFRPELIDGDDSEAQFGFLGLVEGSASWVEEEWKLGLSSDDRAELGREESEFGASMDLTGLPDVLLIDISLPYQFGPLLVSAIVSAGGTELLDAALLEPPVSGEQMMFPAAFLNFDPPITVPLPETDGGAEVLTSGVFGASGLLEAILDADAGAAFAAAEAWGGDSFVAWADGEDHFCLRVDVIGDGVEGTDEILSGFELFASRHKDAVAARNGEFARLTACG